MGLIKKIDGLESVLERCVVKRDDTTAIDLFDKAIGTRSLNPKNWFLASDRTEAFVLLDEASHLSHGNALVAYAQARLYTVHLVMYNLKWRASQVSAGKDFERVPREYNNKVYEQIDKCMCLAEEHIGDFSSEWLEFLRRRAVYSPVSNSGHLGKFF